MLQRLCSIVPGLLEKAYGRLGNIPLTPDACRIPTFRYCQCVGIWIFLPPNINQKTISQNEETTICHHALHIGRQRNGYHSHRLADRAHRGYALRTLRTEGVGSNRQASGHRQLRLQSGAAHRFHCLRQPEDFCRQHPRGTRCHGTVQDRTLQCRRGDTAQGEPAHRRYALRQVRTQDSDRSRQRGGHRQHGSTRG